MCPITLPKCIKRLVASCYPTSQTKINKQNRSNSTKSQTLGSRMSTWRVRRVMESEYCIKTALLMKTIAMDAIPYDNAANKLWIESKSTRIPKSTQIWEKKKIKNKGITSRTGWIQLPEGYPWRSRSENDGNWSKTNRMRSITSRSGRIWGELGLGLIEVVNNWRRMNSVPWHRLCRFPGNFGNGNRVSLAFP